MNDHILLLPLTAEAHAALRARAKANGRAMRREAEKIVEREVLGGRRRGERRARGEE